MTSEDTMQCLTDSGCDRQVAGTIIKHLEQGNAKGAMELLQIQRRKLLSRLHKQQKNIDCLDYLIYQIGREENK